MGKQRFFFFFSFPNNFRLPKSWKNRTEFVYPVPLDNILHNTFEGCWQWFCSIVLQSVWCFLMIRFRLHILGKSLRPYHPEHTRSCLILEAKQGRVWLVLGQETLWARKPQQWCRVLSAWYQGYELHAQLVSGDDRIARVVSNVRLLLFPWESLSIFRGGSQHSADTPFHNTQCPLTLVSTECSCLYPLPLWFVKQQFSVPVISSTSVRMNREELSLLPLTCLPNYLYTINTSLLIHSVDYITHYSHYLFSFSNCPRFGNWKLLYVAPVFFRQALSFFPAILYFLAQDLLGSSRTFPALVLESARSLLLSENGIRTEALGARGLCV